MKVLEFDTDDFSVALSTNDDIARSWKRFQGYIRPSENNPRTCWDYCAYLSSGRNTNLRIFDYRSKQLAEYEFDYESPDLWPVVFETNKYQITIRLKNDNCDGLKVVHRSRDFVKSFYSDYDVPNKVSGEVEILNNPGILKLEFSYSKNGKPFTGSVSLEVVSPKMDTKTDYKSILRAVNEEYDNIIFHYLATTYQQFRRGNRRTDETWLQAFENVVEDYLRNVRRIIDNPNIKSRNITFYRHIDRIKKLSPQVERDYLETLHKDLSLLERKYFTSREYESTINTIENRFVKHTLHTIGRKLSAIFDRVRRENQDKLSDEYQQRISGYQDRLRKYQKHPFFYGIGRFEGLSNLSMVLQSRQGYQQIYKDWLKLNRGISLFEGASNIGTLQIWEIYELWCFVKMKHLVREIMCISPDAPDYEKLIDEPKGSLLNPFTNSSLEHIVRYQFPDPDGPNVTAEGRAKADILRRHQGDTVTLHYQHTFVRNAVDDKDVLTATTEQRPDIVLNIERANGDILLTYLYDAKYRVISDTRLDKEFEPQDIAEIEVLDGKYSDDRIGADYPPPDSINQMHRYRDAIFYSTGKGKYSSKEVIGGYILFPGRYDDASLEKRYFSKSIKEINIGAFPLTPNEQFPEKEGAILRSHLEDLLLNYDSEIDHIEDSIPQRGLKYEPSKTISKGGVLFVCTTSSKDKFDWCVSNRKYPIPLERAHANSELLQASYILFHFDGEYHLSHIVKGKVELKSREDFASMGYPNPSNDFYLVISLNPGYVTQNFPTLKITKEKFQQVFGARLRSGFVFEDTSVINEFVE